MKPCKKFRPRQSGWIHNVVHINKRKQGYGNRSDDHDDDLIENKPHKNEKWKPPQQNADKKQDKQEDAEGGSKAE